jgi:hypothetical protein
MFLNEDKKGKKGVMEKIPALARTFPNGDEVTMREVL